ncbi:signal transduction histidine kinase [Spinactinospora alkalitolerans]|uniref:histidine kinase n=1 Tax=Spinactinospora alkalitolerans TaxID=687207 RepID=A0A852TLB6_9ACTN|nr:signal transduction histidine kinase [Spinactinospora alkalitolerans]
MTGAVSAVVAVGAALVLAAAFYGAGRATDRIHERIDALRSSCADGREDLRRLVERTESGERFAPRDAVPPSIEDDDPFRLLEADLQKERHAAQDAVLRMAGSRPGGESDQQVEVFVNVARRMQSLVHREIGLLDELEAQVEDPDLLKGLFTIDHLATRMRRQSESLAVLGGAASRRQWSRPVGLYEVLRSAVAEVEHYSRVKVVPPVTGTLDGSAVVDVVHLIAELIENATKFSPPRTQVLIHVENVTAGTAIEIEDRGLGVQPDEQRRINGLLADPGRINIGELLRDGRIGLFVVSTLARKHGVRVQLQTNVYGGTQTVVVLPKRLVDPLSQDRGLRSQKQSTRPEPTSVAAARPAAEAFSTQPPSYASGLHTGSRSDPAVNGRNTENGRSGGPATTAPDAPRAAPPQRALGTRPGAQGLGREPAQSPPAADRTSSPPANRSERPPLPERRVQAHLAPQLRDTPKHDGAGADHSPGLMAAFQKGFSSAEEETEGTSSDRTDSTS